MKEGTTNFAYLMDLLSIKTSTLCESIGADKTLVSRWRSGARKLMAGHHWANDIAAHFVRIDKNRKQPVLFDVLSVYYPGEPMDTPEKLEALLVHWLTNAGQREAEYRHRREGVFSALMQKIQRLTMPEPVEEPEPAPPVPLPKLENAVAFGIEGVQGSAIQFLEIVKNQAEPQELLFACPEGLDMLTRDRRFKGFGCTFPVGATWPPSAGFRATNPPPAGITSMSTRLPGFARASGRRFRASPSSAALPSAS